MPKIKEFRTEIGTKTFYNPYKAQRHLVETLFKSPDWFALKCEKYLNACEDDKRMPTDKGLLAYLGISKSTLDKYLKNEDFREVKEWLDNIMESKAEQSLMDKTKPTSGVIFYLKNKFGWVDKTEVDQNVNKKIEITWTLPDLGGGTKLAEIVQPEAIEKKEDNKDYINTIEIMKKATASIEQEDDFIK